MIPEAKYCKKHRKFHNPKDKCPVCEAVQNLKGKHYERIEIGQSKNHQECESKGICGSCSGHKGCS